MRRDLALLDDLAGPGGGAGEGPDPAAPRVRIYSFDPPCLSLGRLQPAADADAAACARDGIDIVRRPTGGRAVLHEEEVTYAVACRGDDPRLGGSVTASCLRIHEVVARALLLLGVPAAPEPASGGREGARRRAARPDCFARASTGELVDPAGRKLVGSAQLRRGPLLLQHGTILLDPPRAHRYLRGEITDPAGMGLRIILGRRIEREELTAALASAFTCQMRSCRS